MRGFNLEVQEVVRGGGEYVLREEAEEEIESREQIIAGLEDQIALLNADYSELRDLYEKLEADLQQERDYI